MQLGRVKDDVAQLQKEKKDFEERNKETGQQLKQANDTAARRQDEMRQRRKFFENLQQRNSPSKIACTTTFISDQ